MCSNFSYVTKGTETDNTSFEIIISYINLTELFELMSQKVSAVVSETISNRNSLYFVSVSCSSGSILL